MRIFSDSRTYKSWIKSFEVYIDDGENGSARRSEIIKWIANNIEEGWVYPNSGIFWFQNEEDAVAFKLRWI